MSTKGRKVLSYEPERMVSFEWNLPLDEFPELKNNLTWVVVDFTPVDSFHNSRNRDSAGLESRPGMGARRESHATGLVRACRAAEGSI